MNFRTIVEYVDIDTAEELCLTKTQLKNEYIIIGSTKESKRINEYTIETKITILITKTGTQIKLL